MPHNTTRKPVHFRLVSGFAYCYAAATAATLRLRVIGEDHLIRVRQELGLGAILVTWHGRTLIPITYFRNRGYWAIISTSRDGEYQDRIFRRFGFQTVRGSSSARGAVQAALSMTRHLKAGDVLAFTPDGPRGPGHHVQPGAIFMAQKSGCPIIPVGVSALPRRLLRSWDRYLLPAPFARAALLFGEPIFVPAEAKGEDAHREWAARVGAAIDAIEAAAEAVVAPCPAGRDAGQWRRA